MRNPLTALALVLWTISMPARVAGEPAAATSPPSRIQVSFKLDPRLSGPTYGGERWVSPASFSGASAQNVLDARASIVDARGGATAIRAEWTPDDPGMTEVVPTRGDQVRITVKRSGETTVTVSHAGASRKLIVRAAQVNGAFQVNVTQ